MTQERDWSTELALSVAAEVRRHRQEVGLSAQQLADRCAEVGMPIQRSVLANLESGRRTTITVAEVLVLAAALQVPPAQLLFPVGFTDQVQALPGRSKEPLAAIDWFAGERDWHGRVASAWTTPIAAYRWHNRNVELLRSVLRRRDYAFAQYSEVNENRDDLRSRLSELREEMAPLEEKVQEWRERHRGVPIAERPRRPDDLIAAKDKLLTLRNEERGIKRQLDAAHYLKDSLAGTQAQVETFGGRITRIRKQMKEKGWEPPAIPEDIKEYVKEAPWQMLLEPFDEDARFEAEAKSIEHIAALEQLDLDDE